MSMHDTFDLKRVYHLIKNDIRTHARIAGTVAATLIILFAIIPFHMTSNISPYFVILYIGGFIVSSLAFKDFHNPAKAHLALMLPCSNLERFLSKWFLTSIAYAIATLAAYYLISLFSVWFTLLIYHQQILPMDIFRRDLWIGIGQYIILQSIFLLGAIIFKRYAFIKTVLVMGCYFLALTFIDLLITWILCPSCFHHHFRIHLSLSTQNNGFLVWLIAAPFCWAITYLKLTELELK